MAEVDGEVVLTRDASSGRVHKRMRLAASDALLTYEGCNLDSSGEFYVIDSTVGVDERALCERCFPRTPSVEGARA